MPDDAAKPVVPETLGTGDLLEVTVALYETWGKPRRAAAYKQP